LTLDVEQILIALEGKLAFGQLRLQFPNLLCLLNIFISEAIVLQLQLLTFGHELLVPDLTFISLLPSQILR
jgi:hypothetical protein